MIPLLKFCCICICVAITTITHAQIQSTSLQLTAEQYDKIKKLTFKDLEKDTYVKFDNGFIADRFDMKPAYVFNFSDGAERKIYLYKISDLQKAQLGMLAVYKNMKSGKVINTFVPSPAADKKIWGMYIDDLKVSVQEESGFGATTGFVISKELMESLYPDAVASNTNNNDQKEKEDDYEFCFPGESLITLENGNTIPISEIKKGDCIIQIHPITLKINKTRVKELVTHSGGKFNIIRIEILPADQALVLVSGQQEYQFMDATANHPVLTKSGKKELGELQQGDIVYQYDHSRRKMVPMLVMTKTIQSTIDKVYNLKTSGGNTYMVNNVVVFKK